MKVVCADPDFTLLAGDARAVLAELPEASVDLVVTSPPYFQLRDYETEAQTWAGGWEGELGLEPTPTLYAEHLIEVFEACRRVLVPWGSLFVVIDDTYAADRSIHTPGDTKRRLARATPTGYRPKSLLGVPFLLAFAMIEAGWIWRETIVWDKPDAMPESVRDRCTKSHEYVLHFAADESYFWDRHALLEPHSYNRWAGNKFVPAIDGKYAAADDRVKGSGAARQRDAFPGAGRNMRGVWRIPKEREAYARELVEVLLAAQERGDEKLARSVWKIATEDFKGAHYAVFSREIARRPIKGGTSERGVCAECRRPWARVFAPGEAEPIGWRPTCGHYDDLYRQSFPGSSRQLAKALRQRSRQRASYYALRHCDRARARPGLDSWPAETSVVLDPFAGACTTGLAARELGRRFIGVDLGSSYLELGLERMGARLGQMSLV